MEHHRHPEGDQPPETAPQRDLLPTDAEAAAISEDQRRAELFERYVSLGINPEDATSAIEFNDLMAAARQMVSRQVELDVDTPTSGETVPEPPRILLTTPDDLEGSRGVWLDAAVETEELHEQATPFLQHSDDGRLSYRIAQTTGFQGYEIAADTSLDTVTRVAHGIAEHGRAFAAYVDAYGDDQEATEAFNRAYAGSWPSIARWAEQHAEDMGWWEQLSEHVDPALLPHLRIDFDRLGRELTYDAYVVEDEVAGQVHVFRLQP